MTNRKDRLLDKQKLKIIYYYSKMILESSEKLSLTRRSEVGEETTLVNTILSSGCRCFSAEQLFQSTRIQNKYNDISEMLRGDCKLLEITDVAVAEEGHHNYRDRNICHVERAKM